MLVQVDELVIHLERVELVESLDIEPRAHHEGDVTRGVCYIVIHGITTAMLADGAQQAPNGKLYILGGQWDRLTVPRFPAQHPTLAVVVVLRVEYNEALDQHKLEIELTLDGQPKGAKAAAQFITGHAPGISRGTPSFVPLAIPFNNLQFDSPGRYEWVVRIDGDIIGRIGLEVVQGAVGAMTAPGQMPMPPEAPPAA